MGGYLSPECLTKRRLLLPVSRLSLLLAACLIACGVHAQQSTTGPLASAVGVEAYRTAFTAEETTDIRRRLDAMDCLIDRTQHPVVESYLRGYMLRNREKAEHILGRVPAFFPLFEAELRKAGLPEDLKYLAIVESALDARALSRSGAGGLWQFMPGTAAMFGLHIDRTVDERGNPELATAAAVEFLRQEYKRFGDWALVLAAYNGGPGRVRRAMRRSGKKNFWELRRFLPRETRNYVPAFIAATYLHKYGHLHGLQPRDVSLDEQFAVAVPCPFGVSLAEIAQATDLSLDLVKHLNAHCRRDYIPAGPKARCRVPARKAAALKGYLDLRQSGEDTAYVAQVRSRPIVTGDWSQGDIAYEEQLIPLPANTSWHDLAREHGVSTHHLALWNRAARSHAADEQYLRVFHPLGVPPRPIVVRERFDVAEVAPRTLLQLPNAPRRLPAALDVRMPNGTYRLQRYESLLDVWRKFATDMTWQEFVEWNDIRADSVPVPGTVLQVRN